MSKKLIKDLGLMPPNILTPEKLSSYFHQREYAFTSKELVGLKAVGAYTGWLGYSQTGNIKSPVNIAIIGKGITFDSGGISIKPSHNMHHMKFDMLGVATVLALASPLKKCNMNVHLYGCCAENTFHGADTMRPGDVLTYPNGTKVEVVDTDAEGRLVLADGIIEAKKMSPKLIITIATLTGAARAALGQGGTAVFSNRDDVAEAFLKACVASGELAWRLPIWDTHRENIKIKKGVADIKNLGTMAGASTAAAFLEHFIDGTSWLHLDIAGSAYKDEVPTGAMYNSLLKYLLNI